MERSQVEKIFRNNGLNYYQLTSIDDLKKCLGIDVEMVKGYADLTEENKEIYKRFIINYFNQIGMDTKIITVPKAINYVEQIDYLAPYPDEETNALVSIKTEIFILKADGSRKKMHKYSDDDYKELKVVKTVKEKYLRFAFLEGKQKVWLHITHEGNQWY